jgi:pilus assembly protein CpaB
MKRGGRLFIVLGVVLALAAVLLVVVALTGNDSDKGSQTAAGESKKPQDITIVQVKRDVNAHTVLKDDDIEEIVVKDDTVTDDVARSKSQVIGFAPSQAMVKGQRVLMTQLELSGIAEELEPGRRAISMPVDKNNLVAGLLRQDDHVDIVYQVNADVTGVYPSTPLEAQSNPELTGDVVLPPFGQEVDGQAYPFPGDPGSRILIREKGAGNPISKIVLQNVRVLRVIGEGGGIVGESESSSSDLTYLVLDVEPGQAELVHMMLTVGTYQIVLRGSSDTDVANTPGATMELLVTDYNLPIPKTIRIPAAGAQ